MKNSNAQIPGTAGADSALSPFHPIGADEAAPAHKLGGIEQSCDDSGILEACDSTLAALAGVTGLVFCQGCNNLTPNGQCEHCGTLSKAGSDKIAEQVDVTAEGADPSTVSTAPDSEATSSEGDPEKDTGEAPDRADTSSEGDPAEDGEDEMSKALAQYLVKGGGEGSRGGRIIGHTSSNKPIYYADPADKKETHMARHAGFTSRDHAEAADAHQKAWHSGKSTYGKQAASFHAEAAASAPAAKPDKANSPHYKEPDASKGRQGLAFAHENAANAHAKAGGDAATVKHHHEQAAKHYDASHKENPNLGNDARAETQRAKAAALGEKTMQKSDPLAPWLKSNIPGAEDLTTGKMAPALSTEERKDLDSTTGENGRPVEVSRAEEGGRLAGVGTTSGPSPKGPTTVGATVGAANPGKTERFSEDDPEDTDKMKSNEGMQSRNPETENGLQVGKVTSTPAPKPASDPKVGAPGVFHNGNSSKMFPAETAGPPMAGGPMGTGMAKSFESIEERQALERQRAADLRRIRYGEEEMHKGLVPVAQLASAQAAPEVRKSTSWVQGHVHYSDASDLACDEMLNKSEFYHGGSPGFAIGNDLQVTVACPACNSQLAKAVTRCTECGHDRVFGHAPLEKSVAPVYSTVDRGPGLRRPVDDSFANPNGFVLLDD